jgi:predicted nucleic acid-binding Zn finger protein
MPTFKIDAVGYVLHRAGPGTWQVTNPYGKTYLVEPRSGSCSCLDFATRGHKRACKHLRALWALLRLIPELEE